MPNIELVFDFSGHWVGIYKRGRLVYQGHSIEPDRLLDLLGVPYVSVELDMEANGMSLLPRDRKEVS